MVGCQVLMDYPKLKHYLLPDPSILQREDGRAPGVDGLPKAQALPSPPYKGRLPSRGRILALNFGACARDTGQ